MIFAILLKVIGLVTRIIAGSTLSKFSEGVEEFQSDDARISDLNFHHWLRRSPTGRTQYTNAH